MALDLLFPRLANWVSGGSLSNCPGIKLWKNWSACIQYQCIARTHALSDARSRTIQLETRLILVGCVFRNFSEKDQISVIYPIFRDRPDLGGGSQILAAIIISNEMCCDCICYHLDMQPCSVCRFFVLYAVGYELFNVQCNSYFVTVQICVSSCVIIVPACSLSVVFTGLGLDDTQSRVLLAFTRENLRGWLTSMFFKLHDNARRYVDTLHCFPTRVLSRSGSEGIISGDYSTSCCWLFRTSVRR